MGQSQNTEKLQRFPRGLARYPQNNPSKKFTFCRNGKIKQQKALPVSNRAIILTAARW